MNKIIVFFITCWVLAGCAVSGPGKKVPKPLKVGYSIPLSKITPERLSADKAAGIDYIEVYCDGLVDDNRKFKYSDEEIIARMRKAKAAANKAGIAIWSIHMLYGKNIDISMAEESERQAVVALHKKMLGFVRVLRPEIILFHPSFYLGLNERETRKNQMIKSSVELLQTVKEIKATMVIENMLGPALLVDKKRERPLCRTVEETVEIMNRLPASVYAAVDMNHIKNPENLIRALGTRLKSVHMADGHGEKENHYYPCSGQGSNNWTEILAALEEAKYTGPFLFESGDKEVKNMKNCYQTLYTNFIAAKKAKTVN